MDKLTYNAPEPALLPRGLTTLLLYEFLNNFFGNTANWLQGGIKMNTHAHHTPYQIRESSVHLGPATFQISRQYIGNHSAHALLQERILKEIDMAQYIDEPTGRVV